MSFALFCLILDEKLVYHFTDNLTADQQTSQLAIWYDVFRESYYGRTKGMDQEERVVRWMRDYFTESSFDSYSFRLKDDAN